MAGRKRRGSRKQYPRWIERDFEHNLREVAPNLFVGAEFSPGLRPKGDWGAVVDLYGTSTQADHAHLYAGAQEVLARPFLDGDFFPPGVLEDIEGALRRHVRRRPVLVHCQAGLSRSASAAYAMMRVWGGLDHAEARRRVYAEANFPRKATLSSARRWAKGRLATLK